MEETRAGEPEEPVGHVSAIAQQASLACAHGDCLRVSRSHRRVHPTPQLFKAGPTAACSQGLEKRMGRGMGWLGHVLWLFGG